MRRAWLLAAALAALGSAPATPCGRSCARHAFGSRLPLRSACRPIVDYYFKD
jgi:hypothetical protein